MASAPGDDDITDNQIQDILWKYDDPRIRQAMDELRRRRAEDAEHLADLDNWVIDFRNGGFLVDVERDRTGSLAQAKRFASEAEVSAFLDEHEWIVLNGGWMRRVRDVLIVQASANAAELAR